MLLVDFAIQGNGEKSEGGSQMSENPAWEVLQIVAPHDQLRSSTASKEEKHLPVSWGGGGRAGTWAVLQGPGCPGSAWFKPALTNSTGLPGSGLSGPGCCLHEQRCWAKQSWKQTELCLCIVSLTGFWGLPGSTESSLYLVWTVMLLAACYAVLLFE